MPLTAKQEQEKHRRQALMYLRDGSPLGGVPVLQLIQEAIYALDPDSTPNPNLTWVRGMGVALYNLPQAIKLTSDALIEVAQELGHQNGTDRAKSSRKKKRK